MSLEKYDDRGQRRNTCEQGVLRVELTPCGPIYLCVSYSDRTG